MDAHIQKTTTEKLYNSGPLREQLLATMEQWEDRNAPITADFRDRNGCIDLIA